MLPILPLLAPRSKCLVSRKPTKTPGSCYGKTNGGERAGVERRGHENASRVHPRRGAAGKGVTVRWSVKIIRVAGIEVKLHVTFLFFLAWIAFGYFQTGGLAAATEALVFMLALFGCVLLHEFGHALTARAFGIPTPDITLLPIGGVARLRRMPDEPWQELLVAIAGPMVNIVIAAVLVLILGSLPDLEDMARLNQPAVEMMARLAAVNIGLVLFNLIPAFPMDGGRVLRALLAMMMPYSRATGIAAGVGQGLAFVFAFAGLFLNPMLILIALFVFLGAEAETAQAVIKDLGRHLRVADAAMTEFRGLTTHARLADAVDAMVRAPQQTFPVLDDQGWLVGVLTRDAAIAAYRRSGPDTPVIEVMHTPVPAVPANAPFEEGLRLMQEHESPALAVVNEAGRLTGLMTPESAREMMMIRSALPQASPPSWRAART